MSELQWITDGGIIFEGYEGTNLNGLGVALEYSPKYAELSIISGNLPDSIYVGGGNHSGNTDGYDVVWGILPNVTENTIYTFAARLTLKDSDNNVIEVLDRWFSIKNNSYNISFNMDSFEFNYVSMSYLNIQFPIKNSNGNEIFKKIRGELPEGLFFNENGTLYGTLAGVEQEKTYKFTIAVYVNDEIKIEQEFTFNVLPKSKIGYPIWITDTGYIGTAKYNFYSEFYVKAYDINGLTVSYQLVDDDLPNGLTFNGSTGLISGYVTEDLAKNWYFSVLATNGNESVLREFYISTMASIDVDKVEWTVENNTTNNSDSTKKSNIFETGVKVGDYVDVFINCGFDNVVYDIVKGKLPDGLTFSRDGHILGQVEPQELKDYEFTIWVLAAKTIISKDFSLRVNKGIGKNSVKAFLQINMNDLNSQYNALERYNQWLEETGEEQLLDIDPKELIYENEFDNLLSMLDLSSRYKPYNREYDVYSQPRIDIGELTCFDKVLLKQALDFGTPVILNIGKTHRERVITGIDTYDIIYKEINDLYGTWATDEIGGVISELPTVEEIDGVSTIKKTDDVNGSKIYVIPSKESTTGYITEFTKEEIQPTSDVLEEKKGNSVRFYFKNASNITYTVGNIQNIRQLLRKKIYVKQYIGAYHINMASQEIVENNGYSAEFHNPWIYDPLLNDNWYDKEILLPYISNDDILYDEDGKAYIQFLQDDILPEWKATYYPTIDLLYSKPYSNIAKVNLINVEEAKGDFWFNSKFMFYELTFEPIFNQELDNFAINFYNPVVYKNPETNKLKKTLTINAHKDIQFPAFESARNNVESITYNDYVLEGQLPNGQTLIQIYMNRGIIDNNDPTLLNPEYAPLNAMNWLNGKVWSSTDYDKDNANIVELIDNKGVVVENGENKLSEYGIIPVYELPIGDVELMIIPSVFENTTVYVNDRIILPTIENGVRCYKTYVKYDIDFTYKIVNNNYETINETMSITEFTILNLDLEYKNVTQYFYVSPSDTVLMLNGTIVYSTLVTDDVAVFEYLCKINDVLSISAYSIDNDNGYKPFTETLIVNNDDLYHYITLTPNKFRVKVIPTPGNAEVEINGLLTDMINGDYNSTFKYTLTMNGYETLTDTYKIKRECKIYPIMKKYHRLTIVPTVDNEPKENIKVQFIIKGEIVDGIKKYEYINDTPIEEYYVDVTDGDIQYILKDEYSNIDVGTVENVYSDTTVWTELNFGKVVFILLPTPYDSIVYINGRKTNAISETIDNIPLTINYEVSKDGYLTIDGTEIIMENTIREVNLVSNYAKISIIPTPSDATVEFDTTEIISQDNNKIVVPTGSMVRYIVSKNGYQTVDREIEANNDEEIYVVLEERLYTFTIIPTPSDAIIEINGVIRNSISVEYNTFVTYKVQREDYIMVMDNYLVTDDTELEVTLPKQKVTLNVVTIPEDAQVMINGTITKEYTAKQFTIANIIASKEGYTTIDMIETMDDDKTVEIELMRYYTLTIVSNPSEAKILINGEETHSKQIKDGDIVTVNVSLEGYETVEKEYIMTKNITEVIELRPLYTLTIIPIPADSLITINGENRNEITLPRGETVNWSVYKHTYITQDGSFKIVEDEVKHITLQQGDVLLSINPYPRDAKVIIDDNIRKQKIVSAGTTVIWGVMKEGYITQSSEMEVSKNETLYIELQEDVNNE